MTNDKIALRELLEKGSDAGFLREMIGFAAQRLMELETEELCGAAQLGRIGPGDAGECAQRGDDAPATFVREIAPRGDERDGFRNGWCRGWNIAPTRMLSVFSHCRAVEPAQGAPQFRCRERFRALRAGVLPRTARTCPPSDSVPRSVRS